MLLTSDLPSGIYECHLANQPTTKESVCDGAHHQTCVNKTWSAYCIHRAVAMYSPGIVGGLHIHQRPSTSGLR